MKPRLGVVTPVVHVNPRWDPPGWEEVGSLEDVLSISAAADRAGFDWMACSEHIAVPLEAHTMRGGRYWDPFTTLAVISTVTERTRLLTHMAVLPYHHPLELVKRLGTLDLVSRGRVVLGVGVGSLRPEFEVLGHQFENRGERADDALRAIRAAWGQKVPKYSGPFFQFDGFVVEPSGLARPLDVWVGGRTVRSLRRAVELGDAWMPFRLTLEELRAFFERDVVKKILESRETPLEFIFAPEPPIDPLGHPDETVETLRAYQAVGATGFSLRFRQYSPTHFIEQLEATMAIAPQLAS